MQTENLFVSVFEVYYYSDLFEPCDCLFTMHVWACGLLSADQITQQSINDKRMRGNIRYFICMLMMMMMMANEAISSFSFTWNAIDMFFVMF